MLELFSSLSLHLTVKCVPVPAFHDMFLVFPVEVQMALREREPYFHASLKGLDAHLAIQIPVNPAFLEW